MLKELVNEWEILGTYHPDYVTIELKVASEESRIEELVYTRIQRYFFAQFRSFIPHFQKKARENWPLFLTS